MRQIVRHIWYLYIILMITGITSCRDEHYGGVIDVVSEGSGTLVLDVNLYGDDQGAGLMIESLEVLSFYRSGDNDLFLYRSEGCELLEENGTTKKFKIEIEKYTGLQQKLVLLANVGDEVEALGEIQQDTPKETVLSRLEFNFTPQAIANPDNPVTGAFLPMWGESGYVVIDGRSSVLESRIDLIRSVVRLDVTVTTFARPDFTLKEVYLYNRDEKGRVAPVDGVYNTDSKAITEASIPTGYHRIPSRATQPISTSSDGINIDEFIYMVENAPTGSPDTAMCLIVGGVYAGDAKTTYYRVDFRTSNLRRFRSLLRNHHYRVGITSILGSGYETPDEAFEKTWKNIDTDIMEWSMTEVEWEDRGNYWLKASPGMFYFMKKGGSGTFTICSDYENLFGKYDRDGWTGELFYGDRKQGTVTETNWITFDDGSTTWNEEGEKDEEASYSFTVDEYFGNDWKRHAWLRIQAGNLVKYIDIYQTNEVWVEGGTDGVYDWTESSQSDVEFDRYYRLGVSRTDFEVLKKDTTLTFSISTDYKDGYETRVVTSDGMYDWFTIESGASGDGPGDQDLTFSITHNQSRIDRDAYIYVTAGNLVKVVKIRQVTWIDGGVGTDQWEWLESQQSPTHIHGYRLGVSQSNFEVDKSNTLTSLQVSTDHEEGYTSWVESSDGGNTWITIENGGSSTVPTTNTLTFSINHNTTTEDRNTTIYIQAGNLIKHIYVKQITWIGDGDGTGIEMEWIESDQSEHDIEYQYRLGVSRTHYEFTKNAQQDVSFYVSTDYLEGYTIEITEGSEWIRNLTSTGNNGVVTEKKVSFDLLENNTFANRKGIITVRARNLVKHITVSQSSTAETGGNTGQYPWEDSEQSENGISGIYLGLSQSRFDLQQNGRQITFYLTTNHAEGYTIEIVEGDSWVSNINPASSSMPVAGQQITFDVAENKGNDNRKAVLLVTADNVRKYINIYQNLDADVDNDLEIPWTDSGQTDNDIEYQYRLGVSRTVFEFTKNAQSEVAFYVTTDHPGGYTIELSEGESWIRNLTPLESTVPVENEKITFNLLENSSNGTRQGTITVRARNMVKQIIILQTSTGEEGLETGQFPWEDSEQSENGISGIDLRLSQSRFDLGQNSQQITFTLTTNCPEGYAIEVVEGSSWVSNINPATSTAPVAGQEITFNVAENKTTGDRKAVLLISADNIRKYINVYQSLYADADNNLEIPWTDSEQSDNEIEYQYSLGVSQTAFEFTKNAQSEVSFYVNTDYPDGYTLIISEGESWIRNLTPAGSTVPVDNEKITFDLLENSTKGNRQGTITVRARNLVKKVVIKQTSTAEEGLGTDQYPWEDSEQSENGISGIDLRLSQSSFDLSQNKQEVTFLLTTTCKEGYAIQVTEGNSWITNITPAVSISAADEEVITFNVAENKTSGNRKGMLLITADNIRKYVPVYQNTEADADIDTNIPWTDSGMSEIDANQPYSVQVEKIKYEFSKVANSAKMAFTADGEGTWTVNSTVNWLTVQGTTSGIADGERVELDFNVAQLSGASNRTGVIQLHLIHGGQRILKEITVTQYAGDMVTITHNYTNGGMYVTDQSKRQNFTIQSGTAWEIEVANDPDGIIRTVQTSGGTAHTSGSGEPVYFVLNNFAAGGPYEATLHIISLTGSFQPYAVTIKAQP